MRVTTIEDSPFSVHISRPYNWSDITMPPFVLLTINDLLHVCVRDTDLWEPNDNGVTGDFTVLHTTVRIRLL